LALYSQGCFNLHPAYLPYNRGAYSNVWSIVDKTPAGVTLHSIDVGLDTGAIVARLRVEKQPWDTGLTLYRRLEDAGIKLFKESWIDLRENRLKLEPQILDQGTTHRLSDVNLIDEIKLDKTYKAEDLLNILRARTFPPHKGAYFMHDKQKIYVRVELQPEISHG